MLSRRGLLAALAAGGGAAVLAKYLGDTLLDGVTLHPRVTDLSPPTTADDAWTSYLGANQDTPVWAAVQRGGAFGDGDGRLDTSTVQALLRTHDLLSWSAPTPSQSEPTGVAEFMDQVRNSNGAWWRDIMNQWTSDLISTHAETPHKVIAVQMGNEINAAGYVRSIKSWAEGAGLPFPPPQSRHGDGVRDHSRDHIGYYVEYFLAPGVEGIRAAHAAAADDSIPILLGTIANVRNTRARESFLPALLDYQIEGTFAPTLAGKRVKFIVDYLGIHYLLSEEKIFGYAADDGTPLPNRYQAVLDDLHDRWVRGPGSIRGIWHTEEGGDEARLADRHAGIALSGFARAMSWALDRGASPEQIRLIAYYKGIPAGASYEPRRETSWDFGLTVLHRFLGHDTRLINRSHRVSVDAADDDPIDTYGFETDDHRRRVLFVFPQTTAWQGPTTVGSIVMGADGWTVDDDAIDTSLHLFKSDDEGYVTFAADVSYDPSNDRYEITLPDPVELNANRDTRVLMVQLERVDES